MKILYTVHTIKPIILTKKHTYAILQIDYMTRNYPLMKQKSRINPEDRINPSREKQASEKNKKNMKEVVENERNLYERRNYIINVFKTTEEEDIEALEEEKPDIKWLYRPESELLTIIQNAPFEDLKKIKITYLL